MLAGDIGNPYQYIWLYWYGLNELGIDFLEDALQNNENCVIMAHHLPSDSLTNIKYKI